MTEDTHFSPGVWAIIISTTGQGAFPFHMRGLWKAMMKKNYTLTGNVHFAVYAIGDRGYG